MGTQGRKPGTMVRCKCKVCMGYELVRGCGSNFRCSDCKAADRGASSRRPWRDSGQQPAQAHVAILIRAGVLPHPTKLKCADCNCAAVEYEHRDYNKPGVVEPICRRCNLLRGPAIPLRGRFESYMHRGQVPYRLRVSVEKLFLSAGLYFPRLQEMPRRLGTSEWLEIMPVWTAHQSPATETAEGA